MSNRRHRHHHHYFDTYPRAVVFTGEPPGGARVPVGNLREDVEDKKNANKQIIESNDPLINVTLFSQIIVQSSSLNGNRMDKFVIKRVKEQTDSPAVGELQTDGHDELHVR